MIQQTSCSPNLRRPWDIYIHTVQGESRYLMTAKRPVMVYLCRAFSKCESYKRQLCRASEASKYRPTDRNLETRPNGAKYVQPTSVGTPRPTQIIGAVADQIRSKPTTNHASDCVLLPHIKFTVYSVAQQPIVGKGLLIIHALRSHSDTAHSAQLLWTMNQQTQRTLPDGT